MTWRHDYRQVSNIRRALIGNQIVDHSGVVGASPVGAAPTTSSFSTSLMASIYYNFKSRRETFKFFFWNGATNISDPTAINHVAAESIALLQTSLIATINNYHQGRNSATRADG